MANYINKYATQSDYDSDNSKQYPNTSYVVAIDEVIFAESQPAPAFGGLTVKYNIVDPSVEVTLFNGGGSSSSGSSESSSESGSGSGGGGALPTTMIVDGVSETPINTWRFSTAGEHIVQYEFEDNEIPVLIFSGIADIVDVIVGDDITTVGKEAFNGCDSLMSVTIGTGVASIGDIGFYNCNSLTSITVEPTTPPTLGTYVFDINVSDRKIYVPAASLTAYQTAWSDYASDIEAIS